jgi:hypothetical protein
MNYRVRYYSGPHTGSIEVNAENEEHALALVRAQVRRELTTKGIPCASPIFAQVVAQVVDGAST